MSLAAVRAALETALSAITPALATAWENRPYSPVSGTPYQRAYVMRAQPDNSEIGPYAMEQGIFQVSLFYPENAGPAAAEARAELIRTAFARGSSFTSGETTVRIIKTPEVAPAMIDGDRFALPVSIRWTAQIAA